MKEKKEIELNEHRLALLERILKYVLDYVLERLVDEVERRRNASTGSGTDDSGIHSIP